MGTAKKSGIETSVEQVLADLENVAEQIRLKLKLAGKDANVAWNDRLEPRLAEARVHAREAKEASKAAVEEAVKAFKEFAASL